MLITIGDRKTQIKPHAGGPAHGKDFLLGGGNRENKLTYIIFVDRVWEACHLNEVTDLRETSQTRTIEARFLEDLNQSGGARRLFPSSCSRRLGRIPPRALKKRTLFSPPFAFPLFLWTELLVSLLPRRVKTARVILTVLILLLQINSVAPLPT